MKNINQDKPNEDTQDEIWVVLNTELLYPLPVASGHVTLSTLMYSPTRKLH